MEKVLVINISQLATPKGTSSRKGAEMSQIEIVKDAAVYIEDGIIKAVGKQEDILKKYPLDLADKYIDAGGNAVIPGFVDSHTHFLFGGYREDEFIDRINGVPYLELLRRGGGIMSTVKATRECDRGLLKSLGQQRLDEMLSQGVTTIEGKSGYGLDRCCELEMLEIMKELDGENDIDIVSTYLGGHAVPEEYSGNSGGYIDFMIKEMLPEIREKGLADFCDIFCEDSVFSIDESRKLFTAAKEMGFGIKIHADEIVCLGGAELAAEVGAVSADHLLMISDEGVKALGEKNVTATLLPNTAFCLAKPYAPARKLIDSGAAVALASDYNPGSCFANSVPLMLALAVIHMHMTVEEALTAMTLNGAAAVGRADSVGSIETGKKADMLILSYPSYKFLVYHTGSDVVKHVIKNGKIAASKS
ncbi:MAG: imidazolonepropionase [Huintestinicola sp.]